MDEPISAIQSTPIGHDLGPGRHVGPSPFQSQLDQVLTVSAHAKARLAERGVHLAPESAKAVAQAVDMAKAAGSKTAAVVTEGAVLVVSPPTGTVITAMTTDGSPMTMVNRIDTVVFVGRTSREETPRSGRIEGAPSTVGHWSLLDAQTIAAGSSHEIAKGS